MENIIRIKKKKNFRVCYRLYNFEHQERTYEAWDVQDAGEGLKADMRKELKGKDSFIELDSIAAEREGE